MWVAVIALVGLVVMLYPVFATQANDVRHRENARKYEVSIADTSADAREASLADAETYNANYHGGLVLDPYLNRIANKTPEYQDYLHQLSLLPEMSIIKVPSADIDLPVYHGTDDNDLKRGVGHLYGSSLPVGGPGTHAVLTGHTGLGDATLFNNLHKVVIGDDIYLNTEGRILKYTVSDISVVLPTEFESLKPVPGQDLITLITCTPYGINSHRLLVTATRAPLEPEEQAEVSQPDPVRVKWEWWMIALLVVAVVSAMVIAFLLFRWNRALAKGRGLIDGSAEDAVSFADDGKEA